MRAENPDAFLSASAGAKAPAGLADALKRIGEVAAAAADDVDAKARFPSEALAELRKEKLLGAFVPPELGGLGQGMVDLASTCELLGQQCSSAAMILAMHHIQAACIVRHGLDSLYFRNYLETLVKKQVLIASVTSEVGVGGSLRTSQCAVETEGTSFKLTKDATTVSYGESADDLLLTARRTPDSPISDQVLVLTPRDTFTFHRKGEWNTLGMRGTCSPAGLVTASGSTDQILPAPFADVSSQTMVPFAHILWSSVWLGIATAAVTRAGAFVRDQARKAPGQTPPTALRLAELWNQLQLMRTNVHQIAQEGDALTRLGSRIELLSTVGFAIKMNNLKISSSELAVDIVHRALLICGIAGYRNDTRFSVGRQLRDALSGALMVGNDRIYSTNASLLLVHKDG